MTAVAEHLIDATVMYYRLRKGILPVRHTYFDSQPPSQPETLGIRHNSLKRLRA